MGIEASYRRLVSVEFQRLADDTVLADAYFGLDFDEDDEDNLEMYCDRPTASDCYLSVGKLWHGFIIY